MKVVWTRAALDQLDAIHAYLTQTSSEYAQRIIERLVNRSVQISTFPRSGRMVPEFEVDDVRQVLEGSYRIIYLILETRIDVVAVVHTSREGLPDLESR